MASVGYPAERPSCMRVHELLPIVERASEHVGVLCCAHVA